MRHRIVLSGSGVGLLVIALAAIVAVASFAINRRVRAAETRAALESIANQESGVTARELAQWILDNRQDFLLVDLRDPWQFDDYHIPTAIDIPFAQFFAPENLKRLDRNKKIVVYGLGAGNSAQVQLLLTMKGYHAYSLTDGIIAWWDEIMTPTSLRSANPSSSGYQQARQLRERFTSGAASATPVAMPAPSAVEAMPPAGAPKPAAKPAAKAVKPTAKPAATPAAAPKPTAPPPPSKEEERLKLGTGCS